MDFIFELLVQLVVQVFGELILEGLFEFLFRRHQGAVEHARRVTLVVLTVTVGFIAGAGWSAIVQSHGHGGVPKLLWVSLALALIAPLLVFLRSTDGRFDRTTLNPLSLLPWQWTGVRLANFSLLNVSVAVGIFLQHFLAT